MARHTRRLAEDRRHGPPRRPFLPRPAGHRLGLAAACIEFALDAAQAGALVARYAALADDRDIGRRLPFYRTAWLAFRLGYSTMAERELGPSPDGVRFAALTRRYGALLREEILRHA